MLIGNVSTHKNVKTSLFFMRSAVTKRAPSQEDTDAIAQPPRRPQITMVLRTKGLPLQQICILVLLPVHSGQIQFLLIDTHHFLIGFFCLCMHACTYYIRRWPSRIIDVQKVNQPYLVIMYVESEIDGICFRVFALPCQTRECILPS